MKNTYRIKAIVDGKGRLAYVVQRKHFAWWKEMYRSVHADVARFKLEEIVRAESVQDPIVWSV